MVRSDLVHSCSYPVVAEAALRSLGRNFTAHVSDSAAGLALGAGAYAAVLVKRFAQEATAEDWRALDAAMAGSEIPLLRGFRFIVERMLEDDLDMKEHADPRWSIAADPQQAFAAA